MSSRNFWGDLPEVPEVKPPAYFLREQATALLEMTKGILVGQVDSRSQRGLFQYDLDVRAPALDDYLFTVLTVKHEVSLYPAIVYADNERLECADEEEFLAALKRVLGSPKVRGAISSLLALSKAK